MRAIEEIGWNVLYYAEKRRCPFIFMNFLSLSHGDSRWRKFRFRKMERESGSDPQSNFVRLLTFSFSFLQKFHGDDRLDSSNVGSDERRDRALPKCPSRSIHFPLPRFTELVIDIDGTWEKMRLSRSCCTVADGHAASMQYSNPFPLLPLSPLRELVRKNSGPTICGSSSLRSTPSFAASPLFPFPFSFLRRPPKRKGWTPYRGRKRCTGAQHFPRRASSLYFLSSFPPSLCLPFYLLP